ncbi:MAG: hypothetical protein K6C05_05240 [Anaerovibrio sp.]|uniref:hypothetical protein n=1 Tax=Anaerovibrio sp. TaxID=1872532 RepID=UPI0025FD0436|nr:hypothetical protein [Anaerovibrio sp.]MCR5176236.1 hypothetical protein [Anaerovibrio sp.]
MADIKIHPKIETWYQIQLDKLLKNSTYGQLTMKQQNYLYYLVLTGKPTEACKRAGYALKDCKQRAYRFRHSAKINRAHWAYMAYLHGSLDPADYP